MKEPWPHRYHMSRIVEDHFNDKNLLFEIIHIMNFWLCISLKTQYVEIFLLRLQLKLRYQRLAEVSTVV